MLSAAEIASARVRWDVVAAEVALKPKGRELCGLCPFHNEKSPSFYVAPEKGFFYCFGCGANGDAISFLMRSHGLAFAEAVHELNGTAPRPAMYRNARTPTTEAPGDEAAVHRLIAECKPVAPGTAAYLYLHTRYLRTSQPALLAHDALECWEMGKDEDGDVRTLPGLVAPFTDSAGTISALLRIFLTDVAVFEPGRPHDNRAPLRKRKKALGHIGDGAIRLTPLDQVGTYLGLGEGIETADSARQLYRMPVWATGGTARLGYPGHWRERHPDAGARPRIWIAPDRPPDEVDAVWLDARAPSVWLPPQVRRLVIFGDHGETGEHVAKFAALYWSRRGITAEAAFPDARYDDFNSELIAKVDRREIRVRP